MHIRQLIREILLEDFESWITATKSGPAYVDIQTAEMPSKGRARGPRDIKRIWNQHADHQFFDSLIKVHWLSSYNLDMRQMNADRLIKSIINGTGRDEISTMGYLPGARLGSMWGRYGVIIQGRTTLAANDMDVLLTGEHPGNYPSARKKWKSSGFPRRASNFQPYMASNYILDRSSFDTLKTDGNELVVDNWKAVGFVVSDPDIFAINKNTIMIMKKFKLPIYDNNMNPVEL